MARFATDGHGAMIVTTQDLLEEETKAREFVSEVERLEGVEAATLGRYHLEVEFGIAFDPTEVLQRVLQKYQEAYQEEAEIPISESEQLNKGTRLQNYVDSLK